ncbi:YihY/virulence factor BrkB family protein [Streptomyces sp. NPDC088785]|uniref:YihY/virulence factor BrkB family protein n=1 Tax=Streptomyces sp. NPDC088785 TaxID=3365897 RepID=UPI0037F189E4
MTKSTDEQAGERATEPSDRDTESGTAAFGASEAVERRAPDSPTDLPKKAWKAVLKRSLREFQEDELLDRAAALTYYGVLSIFPGLLVVVAILGVAGESATKKILDGLETLAPGPVRDILTKSVSQLQGNAGTGSIMAVIGVLLAVWTASGYVGAFVRTANKVYDVPEGRPLWKVLPLRFGLTLALMALAMASAVIVVFTGGIAEQAGSTIGIGDSALAIWSVAKWPVLAVLVVLMMALLFWATPNVKGRGWRWVTPGGFVALLIWLVGSAGFSFYVSGFSSYNKTYGTMAGVIVFLVWLWLTNLALLLGLEFDAEITRQRAMAAGHPESVEPFVEPRDTQAWDEEDEEAARAQ